MSAEPRLHKIYKLMRDLELTGLPWNLELLQEARSELKNLQSPIFAIQKIAELQKHFQDKMSLQTLQDILIPIERYLHKNIVETEFLITTQDQLLSDRITYPVVIVIENLRSSFNVGSFLRTAEGLGVEKVFLTGYTATPENEAVQKTSLGSHNSVSWQSERSTEVIISQLKSNNYRVVAIETATSGNSISEAFIKQPTAFVFGNERFGLDAQTISLCDEIRKIPLVGMKNSLNVSVCAGIVTYEWIRQWNQK